MFCDLDRQGEVVRPIERQRLSQVRRAKVLARNLEKIGVDVIAVDAEIVFDSVLRTGGKPGANAAANVDNRSRAGRLQHQRNDGSSGKAGSLLLSLEFHSSIHAGRHVGHLRRWSLATDLKTARVRSV